MDVIDRFKELLISQGIEEEKLLETSLKVRKEYGGFTSYVAMHNQRNKDVALRVFLETRDSRKAAKESGYSRAHIYSLFRKHRTKKWHSR